MLGVDPFRLTNVVASRFDIVPPMVATRCHVYIAARAFVNEAGLHMLTAAHRQRFVNDILDWQRLAATHLLVGGNHGDGTGINDAFVHGLGRESAEYNRVNRTDTRTRLHRDHAFNGHRNIDDDAVALFDSLGL